MTSNRSNKTGDYLVQCDRSGFICNRSDCRTTWDNKLVRWDFWEPRHPQDILRTKADNQSVPDARNEIPDPPAFSGDMYYDRVLWYDARLSYESPGIFNVSMVL